MKRILVLSACSASSLRSRIASRISTVVFIVAVGSTVLACDEGDSAKFIASFAESPSGGAVDDVISVRDVLLATNTSGIWRSEDGGDTWKLTLEIVPLDEEESDGTFPGTMEVCGTVVYVQYYSSDGPVLQRSRDSGRSWANVATEHFPDHCTGDLLVDFRPSYDSGPDAADSLHISVNQGSTWKPVTLPSGFELAEIENKVFVLDDSTIYIGTPEHATISPNKGGSWDLLPRTQIGNWGTAAIVAFDKILLALPRRGDARLARAGQLHASRDYGRTWEPFGADSLHKALAISDDAKLTVLPGGRIIVAPSTGFDVFASSTLDQLWQIHARQPGAPFTLPTAVYKHLLIGPSALGPVRSEDGGKTWTVAAEGITEVPRQLIRVGNVLYARGRHKLFRRAEEGGGWREDVPLPVAEYSDESISAADALFVHNGELFVAGLESVYHRRPKETAWREITGIPTTPVQSSSSDFVITGAGESLIVAENIDTRFGNGWVRLYRRERPGGQWERSTELEDITRVHTLVTDTLTKPSVVYGASTEGVIRSANQGRSWTLLPGMERDARALARAGTRLYVGTADAGIAWLDVRADSGAWHVVGAEHLRGDVTAVWVEPAHVDRLIVGTTAGLFWSNDGGNKFSPVGFVGAAATQVTGASEIYGIIEYHDTLLASTAVGLVQLPAAIPAPPHAGSLAARLWEKYWSQGPVFKLVSLIGSIIGTYLLGVLALFASAWRRGSRVFSGAWLRGRAADVLLKVPALTRRILFLGYSRRLIKNDEVASAGVDYFGLPARTNQKDLLPAPDGTTLHEELAVTLQPRTPVLLVGPGGAGKTRVLARLSFLGAKGKLPKDLSDYLPVLVPASQWDGDLASTIAKVLLHRYGVQVTRDPLIAQLEAGKILILFDGVSELNVPDQGQTFQSMLDFATSEEYAGCRFLFSSRPMLNPPGDIPIIELRPLTPENLSYILPRYGLDAVREAHVRKQLDGFGRHAIEPLLFHMAVEDSRVDEVSTTRSDLYERYFRKLLKLSDKKASFAWAGWRYALTRVGGWSLIETGARGRGLTHDDLIIRLNHPDGPNGASIPEQMRDKFDLDVGGKNPAVRLLQRLIEAGLLSGEPGVAWRFTHDTYEEYFAALRLVALIESNAKWPSLEGWIGDPAREHAFEGVIRFAAENLTVKAKSVPLPPWVPESWRLILVQPSHG